MNKEVISDKQGITLIILFLIGESSILVTGLTAEKDIWLAVILSIFMALPVIMIYARFHYIFSNKDLFDIIEICFGKFIGKGIILLYTWYAFHLSTLVLEDFGQFVNTVEFPETPPIISMIVLMILCAWIIKKGIEVMGKCGEFFLIFSISFSFITILLLIPEMDISNIFPVLYNGIKPVIKGAFEKFSIPLAETVVFTIAFSNFKTKKSSYKVYIIGLILGGIFILATSTVTILVLGSDIASSSYYPTYNAIEKINIGELLQRLEVIAATAFILGILIKISICLMAACKGITKIFGYTDYRFMVTPIFLLVINLSYFEFESVMFYTEWNIEIYPYYAFLFQVILPIMIWIVAEIKKKRLKNKQLHEI